MNTFRLLLLILSASSSVHATSDCSACARIQTLHVKLSGYTYSSASDKNKGAQDVTAVGHLLQELASDASPDRDETFRRLVPLAAEALPFDTETSLADSINDWIHDPHLREIYNHALSDITNRCQREFLRDAVSRHACVSAERTAGAYERENAPRKGSVCGAENSFDYERCLAQH